MRPHEADATSAPFLPPTLTVTILPDELILEILLRLPARSLVQFRRVCKSWKTLISSPQFAKDHLQRSIADPSITNPLLTIPTCNPKTRQVAFCPTKSMLEDPSAPTKVVTIEVGGDHHKEMACVLGSCNGLLCLLALDPNSIRLWNPCTGLTSKWFQIEGLSWEPYGFGYDHVHDRYKLLLVSAKSGSEVAKVYTFGANSTSMTTIRGFQFPICAQRECNFVSGTLNWMAAWWERAIVSFDLANETFRQLSIAHVVGGDNLCYPEMMVLRNCLCLCFDHKNTHWEVWMMKEYGNDQSWTKLLVISHVDLLTRPPAYSLFPLHIWKNGHVLAISSLGSKLVLYNSNDGQINYPVIDTSNDGWLDFSMNRELSYRCFHIYYESLVSPLGFTSSFDSSD